MDRDTLPEGYRAIYALGGVKAVMRLALCRLRVAGVVVAAGAPEPLAETTCAVQPWASLELLDPVEALLAGRLRENDDFTEAALRCYPSVGQMARGAGLPGAGRGSDPAAALELLRAEYARLSASAVEPHSGCM